MALISDTTHRHRSWGRCIIYIAQMPSGALVDVIKLDQTLLPSLVRAVNPQHTSHKYPQDMSPWHMCMTHHASIWGQGPVSFSAIIKVQLLPDLFEFGNYWNIEITRRILTDWAVFAIVFLSPIFLVHLPEQETIDFCLPHTGTP